MAKAKKLPSGNYRVQVFIGNENGKRIYKSFTAKTSKEAEFMALEYQLDIKRKRDPLKNTLAEVIDKYIDSKDGVLSPSTICGYRRIKKNNLQSLMNINLQNLNQNIIQNAINYESKKHSPKTVRNAHGLLSSVLKEYYPDFALKTTLPRAVKHISEIPENDDIRRILSAIKDTDIEIPVLLALWMGLRMSEVRGLRWKNVRDNYIIINEAIVDADNIPVSKSTKSFSGTRRIPLPEHLKDLLSKQERAGEYVVPLSGQAIYKRFSRILENNEINHFRFHDLRHANASVMLMLNIPDKYAMERGGWATNNTLKNVYQHTLSTEREFITNKINAYFENIIQLAGSEQDDKA